MKSTPWQHLNSEHKILLGTLRTNKYVMLKYIPVEDLIHMKLIILEVSEND